MKKRAKCLLLAMLLTLTMCVPAFAEVVTEVDVDGESVDAETIIEYYQEYFVTGVITCDEDSLQEYIDYYDEAGYDWAAEGLTQLKEILPEIQDAEVTDSRVETTGDADAPYAVIYEISNDNGTFTCTLSFDESLSAVALSYTEGDGSSGDIGEQLKDAALNTVVGLVVVFSVLTLISCIISLFKFLPGSGAKQGKKKPASGQNSEVASATSAGSASAVPAAQPAQNLVSDGELVAVISAAIAASMGTTSTDGFVVRSIKKRKWK